MKVLVTGGAGFIGSHLQDTLVEMGHDVTVFDDLSTGFGKNLNSKAKFFKIDISNQKKMIPIFKKEQFELIFHTAAQIDVRKASDDPYRDAEVNILGTINLLKNAADFNVRKMIFSSTGGAMYGNVEEPANEQKMPDPKSPYGISKYSDEMYLRFFGDEYNVEHTILRYSNVYGPRQSSKGEAGVVAIFINNMTNLKESILYGFGNMVRDYIFVEDVVEANILSMNNGNKCMYNVGTGKKTSVKELFEMIKTYYPEYNIEPTIKDRRPGELTSSVLDGKVLLRDYDKDDYIPIEIGIKKTVDWFKKEIK